MSDGIQKEIPEMEEESSWEVCSEGSSELLSESEESSDEEYRDQVLRRRHRESAIVSQYRD